VASGFLGVSGTNPAEAIGKMLNQFPGIADGVAAFSKEAIDPHSVTMRMHAQVSIPILAMMMPRPAGATAPVIDPNAPVMEINEELTSISTTPVPDSTFLVPEGDTAVSVADFMAGLAPKPAATTPKLAPAAK
jgi:hypothetical protein